MTSVKNLIARAINAELTHGGKAEAITLYQAASQIALEEGDVEGSKYLEQCAETVNSVQELTEQRTIYSTKGDGSFVPQVLDRSVKNGEHKND